MKIETGTGVSGSCQCHSESLKVRVQRVNSEISGPHNRIRADPDKVEAICRMEAPRSVSDLRKFLGIVNQLGKFSPNIVELNHYNSCSAPSERGYGDQSKRQHSTKSRMNLSSLLFLVLYDPKVLIKVSPDASAFGLGCSTLTKIKTRLETGGICILINERN